MGTLLPDYLATSAVALTEATFGAIISDIMVNELRAVVHELGGERALGRTLSNDRDLRDAIREGFPPAVVAELMRPSISRKVLLCLRKPGRSGVLLFMSLRARTD